MKRLEILILILTALTALSAELRSLWVLPWDIKSPEAIDELIDDAVQNHQNELLVEVRYRSDALYTPNRTGYRYFNPEPRSYILEDDGFDPLEYIIRQAHAHHLKVQAWVIVFNATPLKQELVAENYMYQNYRHWFTHDAQGNPMRSSEQFGYFIDPGVPEVQDYLLNVFSDIVAGYPDLDGLHLDYIRYPSSKWGYHPRSVARYEQAKKQGEVLSWNEWRTRQISDFVSKCYHRIKSINPKIILSAAVFSNIYDARIAYAQDWYDWLDKGIIDRIYPMAYTLDYGDFRDQLTDMKQRGYEEKLIIGLRAWNANGGSLMPLDSPRYNITHINKRIALIRDGEFAGIALFSYEGIKKNNALISLANLAYPPLEDAEVKEEVIVPEVQLASALDPNKKAVDARFEALAGSYVISLEVPLGGRWTWGLCNKDMKTIYSKEQYLLKGPHQIFWNGKPNGVDTVVAGNYFFTAFREGDETKYYIPVTLGSSLYE